MAEKSQPTRAKGRDLNKLAADIVKLSTGEPSAQENDAAQAEKNPAAVALGRLGGLKGGKARAEKLADDERAGIAGKAARARWAEPGR